MSMCGVHEIFEVNGLSWLIKEINRLMLHVLT